ncbi:lambda family phage portal protein [Brucella pseudogrignonensis]|uniref:Lambda family phage portal protein n=2 Tax=Brucella pseudogrignonensis TaxID=419475 RepID=A0ABU1M5I5_9HYPH|nr:lambda family phage portal protein [Brucella pseudogrignonensis]
MMNAQTKPRIRVGTDGTIIGAVPQTSPQHSAEYFRSPGSGGAAALFAWRPALRDARDDVAKSYLEAAARAIDALHNSGWIAGAIEQAVASTIGTGLRLSPRPDRIALGWDEKQANEWTSHVERRWILWSDNPVECDAAGKHTMGELTAMELKTWYAYGETTGLLPSIRRSLSQSRTKVQLVLPHRLVQDTEPLSKLYQGVKTDDFGFPLSYRFMRDGVFRHTVDIAARDGMGRPQVFHIYQGAPGQIRGITPFAPILRVLRQYDQLADATLTAALIQSIFAATVESEAPTEALLQALQDPTEQDGAAGSPAESLFGFKQAWYNQTKIDLGVGGRIAHLFPGEKLTMNRSEHPNDTYEAFTKFLLREIAACLGMTVETLTGDYTGATYSSVRMSTAEKWPITLSRRANICGRFLQHVYEAWLEEEIERGTIPFPGGSRAFRAQRAEACSADWRGPPKPQADDLKSAKAQEIYKRIGVASDEMICNDLGVDWEDVYDQRAREAAKRAQLGLPDGDTMTPDPVGDALITQDEK